MPACDGDTAEAFAGYKKPKLGANERGLTPIQLNGCLAHGPCDYFFENFFSHFQANRKFQQ